MSSTSTRITGVTVPLDSELCLLWNLTSIRYSLNNAQPNSWSCSMCGQGVCHGNLIPLSLLTGGHLNPLEKVAYCLRKQYNTFWKLDSCIYIILAHLLQQVIKSILCTDFIDWHLFLLFFRGGGVHLLGFVCILLLYSLFCTNCTYLKLKIK